MSMPGTPIAIADEGEYGYSSERAWGAAYCTSTAFPPVTVFLDADMGVRWLLLLELLLL